MLLAYLIILLQFTNVVFSIPAPIISDLEKVNIKFYNGYKNKSYTQYNMNNYQQILNDKAYSPKRPTVLFVSGWMMSPTGESSVILINAYLKYRDVNLLVLDWSDYSVGLYIPVLYRIAKISRTFGRYFVKLFRDGLNDKLFHCVGHSMGAHSCGLMGREVQKYSNGKFKFGRITGLDPAGPNFTPPIHEDPLEKNDADFVDTIHSDTFFIGTKYALGHASFFPNFNMIQPGCPPFSLNSFFDYVNDMCSHFHAIRYWSESLNPKFTKNFPSRQCSDWNNFEARKCDKNLINYMGVEANPKIQGAFYVKVTSKQYFDGVEFYNWLVDRIGNRVQNVFSFDSEESGMLKRILDVEPVLFYATGAVFDIQNIDKVNIRFYHGSTSNEFTQYFLPNMTQLLSHKQFSHKKPTAMFIFGWIQNAGGDTSRQLIDAYIERGDYNFLLLDWNDYNVDPYTVVMLRMSRISRTIGRVFTKLFRKGLNDKTFHCVGHSFGAHSCGIIGREIQADSNGQFKLGRVTGLDPARPKFFPAVYENPLSPKDAHFVDTIQTDNFFIGAVPPLGHASFYPNNGELQPGCPPLRLKSIRDIVDLWCSHFCAVRYWTTTLNPLYSHVFPATKCSSWKKYKKGHCYDHPINYMGLNASSYQPGVYFIELKVTEPYDTREAYEFNITRIGRRVVEVFKDLLNIFLKKDVI
ncbi:hypothetical protein PVAND_010710 [Polypedilum vanderplanki]|uniref:Lipase domain-containing protein n=1 Tax=Polypedilum vanderplanki TaxID=319348 RepID=A0A9J6CHN2_POLVA|nr:hypothetical protein PVAND_010710 [Polypedilum vanderplanki]